MSRHALLEVAAVVVLLNLGGQASADLFNFTDAAKDWRDGWGRAPSTQACFLLKHPTPLLEVSLPFHEGSIYATTLTCFALSAFVRL